MYFQNRHSSHNQPQNEYSLNKQSPRTIIPDENLHAQLIYKQSKLLKLDSVYSSCKLDMLELNKKLDVHMTSQNSQHFDQGDIVSKLNHLQQYRDQLDDLMYSHRRFTMEKMKKEQSPPSTYDTQSSRLKYMLIHVNKKRDQIVMDTPTNKQSYHQHKTFKFGKSNLSDEEQQRKYTKRNKIEDQNHQIAVLTPYKFTDEQCSVELDNRFNETREDPCNKLLNAMKNIQDQGTHPSFQTIVHFLKNKNKNQEFEYIIKDKFSNKVTKFNPKLQRVMHFSQESQNEDAEPNSTNIIHAFQVKGINKQLWEQLDNKQRSFVKKQELKTITALAQEKIGFPTVKKNEQLHFVPKQRCGFLKEGNNKISILTQKNNQQIINTQEIQQHQRNNQISIETQMISTQKQIKLPVFLNYLDINSIINLCNKISIRNNFIKPVIPFLNFKIYVGKGNNSQLIKSLIKNRPNWVLASSKKENDINFYWTQTFKEAIHEKLQKIDWTNDREIQSSTKSIDSEFPIASRTELSQIKEYLSTRQIKRLIQDYDHLSTPLLNDFEITDSNTKIIENSYQLTTYNHLKNSHQLGNKKSLFQNLKIFCNDQDKDIWDIVPMTYHITKSRNDPEYQSFLTTFKLNQQSKDLHNVWIIKPGENTNRGNGIVVTDSLKEIETTISQCDVSRSFIIQKYIESPFLYQKRKFDIRCFLLITIMNGVKRVYWYKHGYLRTASKPFNFNNFENKTHLTNDAVQNKFTDYGKYEKGNKVSYTQFSDYLKELNQKDGTNYDFYNVLQPEMKLVAQDAIASTIEKFESHGFPSFELFGLDFMVTSEMKPLLLEFNTNPCIEVGCPVLCKVITSVIEHVMRLVIDPIFQMQQKGPSTSKRLFLDDFMKKNQFELMWHDGKVS